jgi:hypothetical protein
VGEQELEDADGHRPDVGRVSSKDIRNEKENKMKD